MKMRWLHYGSFLTGIAVGAAAVLILIAHPGLMSQPYQPSQATEFTKLHQGQARILAKLDQLAGKLDRVFQDVRRRR